MTGLQLTHRVLHNVEWLRDEHGLSLAEVAEAAGITRQYLYLLRSTTEARVITLDVLARLAYALDVPPSALLRPNRLRRRRAK